MALGIGDDAAVVSIPAGEELVVATDTLVSGVHFPAQTTAADLGFRSLAVNLSDLAAMGARPAWATLALTVPEADESWLAAFAGSFFALGERFDVALIGGDTTRGPLTITVQLLGLVPAGQRLCRHTARPGDDIFVTGTIGDAAAGLGLLQTAEAEQSAHGDFLIQRFLRPEPRVVCGRGLLSVANAAIDLSDGLIGDLAKLAEASGVGARVALEKVPVSDAFAARFGESERAWQLLCSGGDDYELLFSCSPDRLAELPADDNCKLTRIGEIVAGDELDLRLHGRRIDQPVAGYSHF